MPSIEISLSSDSHGVNEFSGNHHQGNGASPPTSMMALHDEDKVRESISFSRVGSKEDGSSSYYHEIIEISDDEIEDQASESGGGSSSLPIKRTLSNEGFLPTELMGQFQWIIQHNFASRAMPRGSDMDGTRKRSPLAVNFVEYRI